jgi:ferredoxin
MKAVVDLELCEGNLRCANTAPEVFVVGDDDRARVLLEEVPPELLPKVERAVRLCPRAAVRIEQ